MVRTHLSLPALGAALLFPLVLATSGACGGASGTVLSTTDGGDTSQTNPAGDCTSSGLQGDEGTGRCACTAGESRACYTGPAATLGVGSCKQGVQNCGVGNRFGACEGEVIPSPADSCTIDSGVDGSVEPHQEGGIVCGGIAGIVCPADQYCDKFPKDDVCGGGDMMGQCYPRPTNCPPTDCPGVCGCNHKTYCNTCGAAMEGIVVAHTGPC